MCGIFGDVGPRSDAAAIVLRGLKQLEYRGYDSWGVAVATAGFREWGFYVSYAPSPIDHEMLLHLRPDVAGHVNGGTTSLDDDGLRRLIAETDMAMQVVQAGNLRSSLLILRLAREEGALHRVCLARAGGGDRARDRQQRAPSGCRPGRSRSVSRPISSCATRWSGRRRSRAATARASRAS